MSNTRNSGAATTKNENNNINTVYSSDSAGGTPQPRAVGTILNSGNEQQQMETGKFSSYQEAASFFKKFT